MIFMMCLIQVLKFGYLMGCGFFFLMVLIIFVLSFLIFFFLEVIIGIIGILRVFFSFFGFILQFFFFCEVYFVQGYYDVGFNFEELECEVEVVFKVGCIDDVNDYFGFFFYYEVFCYFFINGIGGQVVYIWKINDFEFYFFVFKFFFFFFDGNVWLVVYVLFKVG